MSISLTKGQQISLTKAGGTLTRVRMGLGWDAVAKKGMFGKMKSQDIDLDASCLIFDAQRNLLDSVWFNQLQSRDGAIQHTGDNRTGAGDGDDESIIVDLSRLAPQVQSLVFTVNSFAGQNFSQIENAFCRLIDESNGAELARYDLSGAGSHNAQIMAKVYRDGSGGWAMGAIGQIAVGRVVNDLVGPSIGHL